MAKNLSEVFKETNEILWDGGDLYDECDRLPYICITMHKLKLTKYLLILEAKKIISTRLGMTCAGGAHTVDTWLDENNICKLADQDYITIQAYRKAWLSELEKEFK